MNVHGHCTNTIHLVGAEGPAGEDVYKSILDTGQIAYHNSAGISVHPCNIIYPKSSNDCPEGTRMNGTTRMCE